MGCIKTIFIPLLLIVILFLPVVASAHSFQYGALVTELVVTGSKIEMHMVVPEQISIDLQKGETAESLMTDYFSQFFSVTNNDKLCPFTATSHTAGATTTDFYGTFVCTGSIESLKSLHIQNSAFADFFQSFDNYVLVTVSSEQWTLVFTPEAQEYPQSVTAIEGRIDSTTLQTSKIVPQPSLNSSLTGSTSSNESSSTVSEKENTLETRFAVIGKQFLLAGIVHIWTGADHLLFLLGLILLARSVKKILILVTTFTVAHSVTLVLAGLQIVTLSPRIVEPLIALTVAFVAAQNFWTLWRSGKNVSPIPDWAVTFCFGLIHGLGFAGGLLDAHIPNAFFIPALLVFNAGIEVGQISFVALALLLLIRIDKLKEHRIVLITLSAVVVLMALFWFVQRIGVV